MNKNVLILGSPFSSTWSMRAFFCAFPIIDEFDIIWKDFDSNSKLRDTSFCPTKQVPVLYLSHLDNPIVETFAIADVFSKVGGLEWPNNEVEEWYAKSICLEFQNQTSNLRSLIPMELREGKEIVQNHNHLSEWHQKLENLLINKDNKFLFGKMSIVDVWFAPLLCRFARVNYPTSTIVDDYFKRMKVTLAWERWVAEIGGLDVRYASKNSFS